MALRFEYPELNARNVALGAVFAAGVTVATMMISIPVGVGYLNFGEIVIYIAAFLFGGTVGGLAGGVGAAAADVLLGWAMYAPITLIVKGLEGFVVGSLSKESSKSKLIAVALGAPFMIVGYFFARVYFEGFPAAILQELPIDLIQAAVGAAVALPLSQALKSYLERS
ncbi:MAG: ECF transporter S component [Candidatus Bipolaricaulota bacterium]